ncbi:sialate O-acetylesterase [uncultured Paraglaciecola sp.]|uniref:sialate O-acetylesterase n=1 Tax=uncultured Paraglaciecola sp. TaxID=1765024 RepID=UPI0030D9BA13
MLNSKCKKAASVILAVKLSLVLAVFSADAKLTLAPQFDSNMLLQRDTVNTVQGYADSHERIKISMDGVQLQSLEVQQGAFEFTLPVTAAGGPHTLSLQTQSQMIVLDNILFGDLWLASGQSNMEYTLGTLGSDYQSEIASANLPQIRQFRVARHAAYQEPLTRVAKGQWLIAQGEALREFSAVGYFFAKHLQEKTGVPIGIINNAYAGARIQAWLSEQALAAYPRELALIQRNKVASNIKQLVASDKDQQQQWQQELAANDLGLRNGWSSAQLKDDQWPQLSMPGYWTNQGQETFSGSMWFRRSFNVSAEQTTQSASLELGRIVDQDEVYINGQLVGSTPYQYPQRVYALNSGVLKPGLNQISVRIVSHNAKKSGFVPAKPYQVRFDDSHIPLSGLWRYQVGYRMSRPLPKPQFKTNEQPSVFYNAMLAPLARTQLKGVIWYQGESNAKDPAVYQLLFPAMITQWRTLFAQPKLPFLYVQLANFLDAQDDPSIAGWADIRAAQTSGLALPNTAMVSAIDLGEWNDIHPKDKASVGKRLANAALKTHYNQANVVYQGPLLTCAERVSDNAIKVHSALSPSVFLPLAISGPDHKVQGFAISNDNLNYHWVEGDLQQNYVLLKVENANKITHVSYAWQSNPARANLSNSHKLPAYPAKLTVSSSCQNTNE